MNKFYPLTEKESVINLQGNKSEEYGCVAPYSMFKLDDLEKKMICEILHISSEKASLRSSLQTIV